MRRNVRPELSDFGWAVTWDNDDFKARTGEAFAAGHHISTFHRSPEDAMAAYALRYPIILAADA